VSGEVFHGWRGDREQGVCERGVCERPGPIRSEAQGWRAFDAGQRQRIWSCAFGANGTAGFSGGGGAQPQWVEDRIDLTATPFTDGTGSTGHDDWTLNSGAGGGAACKGVGYLASVPGATGSQVADLGAWQAAAGAGTSGGLLQGNKRAHKQ
jgi:hypothetical protein